MASARGTETFEAAGRVYTAVFGFAAMEAIEDHFDLPFFEAIRAAMPELSPEELADPAKARAASMRIRMTHIGALFRFALAKHHPGLTKADVAGLIDEIGLDAASEIVGRVVRAALFTGEGDDSSPADPPRQGSSADKRRKGRTG